MSTKYKIFTLVAAAAFLAAGCSQSSQPAATNAPSNPAAALVPVNPGTIIPAPSTTPLTSVPAKPECPSNEYSCACATGSYCLQRGAMCLSPNSPCPNSAPAPSPAPAPAPNSASITISNFEFNPQAITVNKGTTVKWINQDSATHTVTGDNGGPSSGNLAQGASYSYTFDQTGSFPYHCSIHPSMTATVIVK